jgi:putative Holliday junction resolvase
MSKILAIDYGLKRCGIAITDDIKMVASPLTTIEQAGLMDFIKKQVNENKVDEIVLGYPVNLKGEDTHLTAAVRKFYAELKTVFPLLAVELYDERFTSSMAQKSISMMDLPKNKREQKGLLDKVSAAILLQNYMDAKRFRK